MLGLPAIRCLRPSRAPLFSLGNVANIRPPGPQVLGEKYVNSLILDVCVCLCIFTYSDTHYSVRVYDVALHDVPRSLSPVRYTAVIRPCVEPSAAASNNAGAHAAATQPVDACTTLVIIILLHLLYSIHVSYRLVCLF